MNNRLNFVEKYVRGQATQEEIYEEIGQWHETGYVVSLHEYLGLTENEHFSFVVDDANLRPTLERYRVSYRRSQFKLIICNPENDPKAHSA